MIDAEQADMLKALLHLTRTRAPFGMEDIDSDYLAERLWMNIDVSRRMVGGRLSLFSTLVVEESLNALDYLIEHHGDDIHRVMELRRIAIGYGTLVEREEQPVTPRMVRDFVALARVVEMFGSSMNRSEADPQALSDALGEAHKLIEANRAMTDDPFLGVLVTEAEKASATLDALAFH